MSKETNPTLIGAFVVGGILLLAAAVAVFGGSDLLARKTILVTYFDGSVKGLRVGSNVVFRGVRVGFVENITLLTDVDNLEPKIEVVMELSRDSIRLMRDGKPVDQPIDDVLTVDELIDAGFSAQLGSESFVTGQLLVELDFRPDQPGTLYDHHPPYPEVPSVPSEIERTLQRFEQLVNDIQTTVDFKELNRRVFNILRGLDELANSAELRSALAGLDRIVNNRDTQRLGASAQATLGEIRSLVKHTNRLVDDVDSNFAELTGELRPAAQRLISTLDAAQQVLESATSQLQGDSSQVRQLQSTLVEMESAARALRDFFDYLERHPEALLRGKAEEPQ